MRHLGWTHQLIHLVNRRKTRPSYHWSNKWSYSNNWLNSNSNNYSNYKMQMRIWQLLIISKIQWEFKVGWCLRTYPVFKRLMNTMRIKLKVWSIKVSSSSLTINQKWDHNLIKENNCHQGRWDLTCLTKCLHLRMQMETSIDWHKKWTSLGMQETSLV